MQNLPRLKVDPQVPPAGDATRRSRLQAMRPAGPPHRRCDPQVLPTGIDIEEDRRRDEESGTHSKTYNDVIKVKRG